VGGEPVQPGPEEPFGPETTDQRMADGGDVDEHETGNVTIVDGMSAGQEDTDTEGAPE
jgi:hypothetical protein